MQQHLVVYGIIDCPLFQKCAEAAEHLNAKYPDQYGISVVHEMPTDFRQRRVQLLESGEYRLPAAGPAADTTACPDGSPGVAAEGAAAAASATADMDVLVVNEGTRQVRGGEAFIAAAQRDTTFRVLPLPAGHADSYEARARRAYAAFLRGRGDRYCWMDVRRGDQPLGRVTFELFSTLTPHASQNFWRLCRGHVVGAANGDDGGDDAQLTYKGTTFFRILKDAWVMGGDVSAGHSGNAGHSCYGRFFPDECFAVPHDGPGVLGMCNDGAHSNASSFYITRKKMSWMNEKYLAFGRIIDGMDVVDAIHATPVRHNQSPVEDVVIADSGVIDL